MAREALKKHFQTYPAGDPRNTVLNEDLIKGLKSLTREELYDWYKTAVSAEHGAIAIVGEFDPAAVKALLKSSTATLRRLTRSMPMSVTSVNTSLWLPNAS